MRIVNKHLRFTLYGADMEFIESELANNEVSSDEELAAHFAAEINTLPVEVAEMIIKNERHQYQKDPLFHNMDWDYYANL